MLRQRDEAGFTMVELLVVMLIAGIMGAFTLASVVQGMRVSNEADVRIEALTDLQRAGQRVSRELRLACTVETATADEVELDVLRSGVRYRYRFHVDGAEVLWSDIDVVAADGTRTDDREERIAEGIANGNVLFGYLDANGASTAVASEVRDMTLTLQREANGDLITWTGDLHMRNGGFACGF